MAGGISDVLSSNFCEMIEKDDEGVESDFVNAREEPNGSNPIINSSQGVRESDTVIFYVASPCTPLRPRRSGSCSS